MTDDDRAAARGLAAMARAVWYDASGRDPRRHFLQWISDGWFGRHRPWRDIDCWERRGWRTRLVSLNGEQAFAVDYRQCRRCRLAWVESPYTLPQYQRAGLASAALAALRAECPRLSWHTLGGHFRDSRAFWDRVGTNVPGGYRQREPCPHVTRG